MRTKIPSKTILATAVAGALAIPLVNRISAAVKDPTPAVSNTNTAPQQVVIYVGAFPNTIKESAGTGTKTYTSQFAFTASRQQNTKAPANNDPVSFNYTVTATSGISFTASPSASGARTFTSKMTSCYPVNITVTTSSKNPPKNGTITIKLSNPSPPAEARLGDTAMSTITITAPK